jgi:hypothetical protein
MGKSKALTLKKISKNNIFIENIFYGQEIGFTFSCEQRPFKVEVVKGEGQFSTEIKLIIGHHTCSLLLESLPPLVTFSKAFEGVDLLSIPEEIRLLVFQTATESIRSHFANILQTAISIDSIETANVPKTEETIGFRITSEGNYITAGTLIAPREVLVVLAKKIKNIPTLHHFKDLQLPYYVRLGSTQLSKEDYQALSEEDIVFLDQYELAKQKKVDIVGLGEARIRGTFVPSGVVVEQVE